MNHRHDTHDALELTPIRGAAPRARSLGRLAILAQLGFAAMGLWLFLDQAGSLLSDAQFTWGERRIMGIAALTTVGGCLIAGWVVGRLIRIGGDLLEVVADGAEASWRTGDLLEQHMIPALGRLAAALEDRDRAHSRVATHGTQGRDQEAARLRDELDTARRAGDTWRVIEIRDALTEHLRGDPLHQLDRELARWFNDLIERQARTGTVDAGFARSIAHALDSLGDMPETAPLRTALPLLRRRAGLCARCGRQADERDAVCTDCRRGESTPVPSPEQGSRPSPTRERR